MQITILLNVAFVCAF